MKMSKMTIESASLSADSPKMRSYSGGLVRNAFRTESVATGSVEEMSDAKSSSWFGVNWVSIHPASVMAYKMPAPDTTAISVPSTAYSIMAPKLAKNLRFSIV